MLTALNYSIDIKYLKNYDTNFSILHKHEK